MNIAWLMPNLHITGGARVAVEIGKRMAEHGHQISILIPSGRCSLEVDHRIDIIECGIKTDHPLYALIFGIIGMLSKIPKNTEIIIASMPPYALLARLIGLINHQKAVNYVLNDDVHFFDDKSYIKSSVLLIMYRFIARLAIRHGIVFTNSHWTAVKCVAEGGIKPTAIVPSGYDDKVFFYQDDKSVIKDHSRLRLVTVGRKPKWKGIDDLIAALNLLDQTKIPFDLRIITQDDLDYSQAKFPYHVVKPQNDHELANFYRWGEIFISSSHFEGFGLPPLEAQACGLSVISADSGGVREFLIDKENCLIAAPRYPQSITQAVEILANNPQLRRKIAQNGLKTCRDFTWDRITEKMIGALKMLVNDDQ